MIGSTLAHFRIVEKLGEGGMGEVYRAQDTKLGREVAIKVLPARLAVDGDRLARFRREAHALASLNHPNILTIHSVEEEAGVHFLATELVAGTTLGCSIPPGGMDPHRFLDVAEPLAEAIEAAHAQGVTHRDLKPANVMITAEGRVKVLDFGLAKLASPEPQPAAAAPAEAASETLTRVGEIFGTIAYMSPEQLEAREVDHRSDLFSLGVLFYEMLSGRRAFVADSTVGLVTAILRDEPAPLAANRPDLPRGLERLVLQCLRKDPADRPQTAAEVRSRLEPMRLELDSAAYHPTVRMAPAGVVDRGKRAYAVAAALVLVLVGLWSLRGLYEPRRSGDVVAEAAIPEIRSLAVLPLENLSGDPRQDYFVDGMTEALIADLAQIGSLHVISRTSVMRYKGERTKSLPVIAEELGVDAVIEGSVQRSGERVRITAQLLHAPTDRHLWADSYTREASDVLALQSEVARAIVRQIQAQLTPAEEQRLQAAGEVDPEAYDAYLKGLSHFYRFAPADVQRARAYFELALEKDPGFAPAYAGLADIWGAAIHWGDVPIEVAQAKVHEYSAKALEVDPSLAQAHALQGKILYFVDRDYHGAEESFLRAIELNPNYPLTRFPYSFLLLAMGRNQEAEAHLRKAMELDPLNPLWLAGEAYRALAVGDFDAAVRSSREALAVDPGSLPAQQSLWIAEHALGADDRALEAAKSRFTLSGDVELVGVLDQAPDYRTAMRRAAELLARRGDSAYVLPSMVARFYALAGDEDQALAWLQKAYDVGDYWLSYLPAAREWDPLRGDPRFQDLQRQLGFEDR